MIVGLSYDIVVVGVVLSVFSLSVGMYVLTAHEDKGYVWGMCVLAVHGGEKVVSMFHVLYSFQ